MTSLTPRRLVLVIIILVACSNTPTERPADSAPMLRENIDYKATTTTTTTTTTFVTPYPLPSTIRYDEHRRIFDDAPELDLFNVSKTLIPGAASIPRTLENHEILRLGNKQLFWLVDLAETKTYQSAFTLKLITPHANWYVEDGLDLNASKLSLAATHFEKDIYPVMTRVFGNEWIPGIDDDRRLNILNAKLNGVAGYFNSTDEYPAALRPMSNQREIIYINALKIPPGSMSYDLVLAHELQHAIHWNADSSEDSWINEGLSELSSSIALGSTLSIQRFLLEAPVSLTNWPTSSIGTLNHYGAASLFMHFLTEHYSGRDDLRDFLSQPEDGINGINAYLKQLGFEARFDDIFKEWGSANILDNHLDTEDEYKGYQDLEIQASVTQRLTGLSEKVSNMPQYAIEYTELKPIARPSRLTFHGDTKTRLLPVDVGARGCWWSNAGDSINSTLSRQVHLPSNLEAVFEYEIWFDVEEHWDYVYIEVSVDGGENWKILNSLHTATENPFGNGFGPGYTGESKGWLKDSIDLTPFSGKNLWVRFQNITDSAINAAGACFRNLSIPEIGVVDGDSGWDPRGFVFIDNAVRQDFQVQLITVGDDPEVRQLRLESNNTGEWIVHPPEDGDRLIVTVGSLAEKTREFASYSISLGPWE